MIAAAVSDGTWTFLGVFVTQAVILVGLFVRQGRTLTEARQANRSVNHQASGEPTLIERVITLERDIAEHRDWERAAFGALATHVGCTLPPDPKEEP